MIQITPRFCPPYPLTFLLFFSVQTKQYKIKTWKVHMHTTNKQTWSLLILSNYFWAYGLHWSVIDILSVLYHWKKLIYVSLSSCQLQITSWLEVGIGIASFFFLFCDFCLGWTCTSLVHAIIVSVSSHVNQPCCVWKMMLLLPYPEVTLFLCPLYRERRALSLIKTSHWVLRTSQSLTLCTICRCESLY